MKNSTAQRVALTGMLFGLAIALSIFESLITPLLGLPPGVKPGLANIVVMFALLSLSRTQALALVVLKAAFALLTRGPIAALLSATGSLVALGIMILLLLPAAKPSMLLLSIAGALGHNAGQLVIVCWLLGSGALYWAPVLVISAIVMGSITALLLRSLLPPLQKLGLGKNYTSANPRS